MPTNAWIIRPARFQDARAIAEVHLASYQNTYHGIFPDALLHGLSIETFESSWRNQIAAPATITLVGCAPDGTIVGFVCGGKERTGNLPSKGELYAIYLRPDDQRKGLGHALVRQLAQDLLTRGFSSMAVWVLERNPATKFYEALGGKRIGQKSIERGGQSFIEAAYGWSSLEKILQE